MKLLDRIWDSDIFAYYNEQTGEIKAKGRLAYLHEEGHSKQFKPLLYLVCMWTQIFTMLIGFASMIYGMLDLFILAGIPTLLLLYLEADAWNYAFKNYKK
jgi:hypothetical protein